MITKEIKKRSAVAYQTKSTPKKLNFIESILALLAVLSQDKLVKGAVLGVLALINLWIVVSIAEVMLFNLTDHVYWQYNLLNLMINGGL